MKKNIVVHLIKEHTIVLGADDTNANYHDIAVAMAAQTPEKVGLVRIIDVSVEETPMPEDDCYTPTDD